MNDRPLLSQFPGLGHWSPPSPGLQARLASGDPGLQDRLASADPGLRAWLALAGRLSLSDDNWPPGFQGDDVGALPDTLLSQTSPLMVLPTDQLLRLVELSSRSLRDPAIDRRGKGKQFCTN